MEPPSSPELSSPLDLFTLDLRVRWLYPKLPRWRFRAPQSASIRLMGKPKSLATSHGRSMGVLALSPLEKYRLIKETDESCYWCSRSIGTKVTIRGRSRRLRLHWDHVTPAHVGGAGDITNMVPSCHLCNAWKAGRVFATEPNIRNFLEGRWSEELAAPIVVKPSVPAHTEAEEYANIARTVAPSPRGKRRIRTIIAHTKKPKVPAARLGKQLSYWSLPKPVRVISGRMTGSMGIMAGESREREGWARVLLGQSQVPWRFRPEQLQAIES